MATDSAVTVNGLKAFNGVQKVFHIHDDVPIGIMINGPSRFCGKSFEKLIDEFKCFKFNGDYTVENIKNNLISFLEAKNFNTDLNEYIKFNLNNFKKHLINQWDNITEDEFEYYIENLYVHEIFSFLENQNISFDDILPNFVKNKKEINEKLLRAFFYRLFNQSSEIIIAGFDEKSEYPSYIRFKLILKSDNQVVYEIINHETNIQKAVIFSFADDGEVKIFLNGIDLELEEFIYGFFEFTLNVYLNNFRDFLIDSGKFDVDAILDLNNLVNEFNKDNILYVVDLRNEINFWKMDRYIPIFNLTQSLPENILIEFAIFLVNLTAFKRKYSLDVENVGGNVVVTIITPKNIRFVDSEMDKQ